MVKCTGTGTEVMVKRLQDSATRKYGVLSYKTVFQISFIFYRSGSSPRSEFVGCHQCCGSEYIEFGFGSRILAQFRSGSRVIFINFEIINTGTGNNFRDKYFRDKYFFSLKKIMATE